MYRENIYDVMEATGEKISTLVIPKNSGLKGYAWKVLREAGLKLDDTEQVAKNKLRLQAPSTKLASYGSVIAQPLSSH